MENVNLKTVTIGTEETTTKLEAKSVNIQKTEVKEVGAKGNKKVVCTCKHPDREETIEISSVEYMISKVAKSSGLWVNLDSEEKIVKNSALASLLTHKSCANIEALEGQEAETILDDSGFLCFKAY